MRERREDECETSRGELNKEVLCRGSAEGIDGRPSQVSICIDFGSVTGHASSVAVAS